MVHAEREGDVIVVVGGWNDKDLITQVPGSRYKRDDHGRDTWRVPLSWGSCRALRGILGDSLTVGPELTSWAWHFYVERVSPAMELRGLHDEQSARAYYDTDNPLPATLKPFQAIGVEWMGYAQSGLLADDMGSGKTVQSLSFLDRMSDSLPAMVVCPNSVKYHWAKHARVWCPDATPYVVDGTMAKKRKTLKAAEADPHALVIINIESVRSFSRLAPYGSIRLKRCKECDKAQGDDIKTSQCEVHEKELNSFCFSSVILDEAHRIGEPKSKQTRAIWNVMHGSDVKYRWALTGTEKDIPSLFSIMHAVAPEDFPQRSKFMERYCTMRYNPFGGAQVSGLNPSTEKEFFAIFDWRFRRMPKEITMPQLPPVVRETRTTELTPAQRRIYTELNASLATRLEDGSLAVAWNDMTKTTLLQQMAAATVAVEKPDEDDILSWKFSLKDPSPKLDVMEEVLTDLGYDEGQGPAVVIAAEHRQLIELACARLTKRGIPYVTITGDVPPAQRERALEDLRSGTVRVLLFTVSAGAVGLDMSAADTLISLQRPWSMVNAVQTERRVYRTGSERHSCVRIIDVITRGTVEEEQVERVLEKFKRLEEINRDQATRLAAGLEPDEYLTREEAVIVNSDVMSNTGITHTHTLIAEEAPIMQASEVLKNAPDQGPKRAPCPFCYKDSSINNDGTVRYHHTDKSECQVSADSRKCKGVGAALFSRGESAPEQDETHCRECKMPYPLTANGRIRTHRARETWQANENGNCKGGSDIPLEEVPVDSEGATADTEEASVQSPSTPVTPAAVSVAAEARPPKLTVPVPETPTEPPAPAPVQESTPQSAPKEPAYNPASQAKRIKYTDVTGIEWEIPLDASDLMDDGTLWHSTAFATVGLIVKGGRVIESPPYGRHWAVGKTVAELASRNGATCHFIAEYSSTDAAANEPIAEAVTHEEDDASTVVGRVSLPVEPAPPVRRILVTGSRDWGEDEDENEQPTPQAQQERETLRQVMTWMYQPGSVLVSGRCGTGADRQAEEVWSSLGGEIDPHPAKWDVYGKRAGFIRNDEMIATNPSGCVAFIRDSSAGATYTAEGAQAAGIKTMVYRSETPAAHTTVVNLKGRIRDYGTHLENAPENLVYVGRTVTGDRAGGWELTGHALANTYPLSQAGTRESSVAMYIRHLIGRPELLEMARAFRGKTLACWCAPELCHADVLARYADGVTLEQLASWADDLDSPDGQVNEQTSVGVEDSAALQQSVDGVLPDQVVSASKLRDWQQCRRKWWLKWVRGLELKYDDLTSKRNTGTRIHEALAGWYVPEGEEKTDPLVTLAAAHERDWGRLAEQYGVDFESEAYTILKDKWDKAATLERAMVEGYMEWLEESGADAGYTVKGSEVERSAVITEDDGFTVEVRGKLDVRVERDIDGARLFKDHKTVPDFTGPTKFIRMDVQMLTYHLLESLTTEEGEKRCDGALYNMLRRVKGTSTAKPPFFHREEVPHNPVQVEAFRRQLVSAARDMAAMEKRLQNGEDPASVAYPSPKSECAWSCEFFAVCPRFDDGSRVEDMIQNLYTEANPWARYNSLSSED